MRPEMGSYKLGVVAGEESGQLLATELIDCLNDKLAAPLQLMGVGGTQLQQRGLNSLFDADEIALTGISSVAKKLPRLMGLIKQTADAIVAEKPDCLLLVDSPDFSMRVARRVKAQLPDLPVVKYVAPSVWAWRPERAPKMAAYIDAILAILPFEPDVMEKLGGPKTHYVGHRLMADKGLFEAFEHNMQKQTHAKHGINLLVLPGSRKSEINALIDEFGKAVDLLAERGNELSVTVPTLERHERLVRDKVLAWSVAPKVCIGREAQLAAYRNADVALAASGTVTLELALAGVPAISCYKVDPLMKIARSLITIWSAALPNIIADRPIIPEYYNEFVRHGLLARHVEEMTLAGSMARKNVLDGYKQVRDLMEVDLPSSQKSAEIILDILTQKTRL